jgi:hypothetical protein
MDELVTGPQGPSKPMIDPTAVPVQEPTTSQSFAGTGAPQLGIRPTSKWDLWWDQVNNHVDEAWGSVIKEYIARTAPESKTKLSADDANRLYPGLPNKFTEEVDPVQAQFAYNEFQRRQSFQAWKDRSNTGLPFDFSAGMAAGFYDPVNVALNYATAGVFGALKTEMTLGKVVASNLLQNTAIEAMSQRALGREQQGHSLEDAALNVVSGAAGGTLFHYGLGALGSMTEAGLDRAKVELNKMPPGRARQVLVRLIKATEGGQRLSPAAAEMESPTGRAGATQVAPEGTDAGFVPGVLNSPSERQFYAPEHGETGTAVPVGSDDYGATAVTDNPTHARNAAAGDSEATNGTVRKVDFPADSNFLPLETKIEDPVVQSVISDLKASGVEIRLPKGSDLQHLLMAAKEQGPENVAKIRESMQKQGVDGYTERVSTPAGNSNITHVFDPAKARFSEPLPLDANKISPVDQGELARLQAEQDSPDNIRVPGSGTDEPLEFPKKPEPIVTPEGKSLTPIELEAQQAHEQLREMAKTDPEVKAILDEIDAREKYDQGMAKVVGEVTRGIDLEGDGYIAKVKNSLLEKGVGASEDDLNAIADVLENLRSESRDSVDFNQKAAKFFEADMIDWPAKRKMERIMNARTVARFMNAAIKLEGGEESVAQKFLKLVRSGSRRFATGGQVNTHNMAEELETNWLQKMRKALGQNLRAAESGLLEREITQEMASLENGGKQPVSGNKQAFEIARVYHDLKEEMFSVKAGYSPFLEKISEYYYRQTHDREKVQAAGQDQWVKDAFLTFGKFAGKSADETLEKLGEVWQSIVDGRYHSSIFDKEAGDYNLAFRLANKRTLRPVSWEAFYNYNTAYGKGNVHVTMADMIRSASRDIAVMSKFGTTPHANVQSMISRLRRMSPEIAKEFDTISGDVLDAMHVQTFAYNRPAEKLYARMIVGDQKLQTLEKNGMSPLKSTLDLANATMAMSDLDGRGFLANFADMASGFMKRFVFSSSEKSNEAAQEFGAFIEGALRNLYLEVGGGAQHGRMDKILQLYSWATLGERQRASMTLTIAEGVALRLAKYAEMEWKDIPEFARQQLLRYGINEKGQALMKHGVQEFNGRKYFTSEKMRAELIKKFKAGEMAPAAPTAPQILEPLPPIAKTHQDSVYMKPESGPYYENRNRVVSPRTGENAGIFGHDLNQAGLAAYNPESAAKVATEVHDKFVKAGYSTNEAGVMATLHSTFFDTIGKAAGIDPLELHQAYNLKVDRTETKNLGSLLPFNKMTGEALLKTRRAVPLDKTLIHESAHFFLETLTDIHRIENLETVNPEFKKELDGLFGWLGVKNHNLTHSSHEQFVNSFEAYLRTNKAPTEGLQGFFATVRDWYRRAFDMFRRGFSGIAISLHHAQRAPGEVESFYNKLLGGSGNAELHGPLGYKPETMDDATLYGLFHGNIDKPVRLPNEINDVIMRAGSIVNDQLKIGTTSPDAAERSIMYGRNDVNTWKGALWRAFWQFKSSTVKAYDSMLRSYYSNPDRPEGDPMKIVKFVLLSMGLYTIQDQVGQMMQGKTPENPATPSYALKAAVGSGAGSVWADTITQEVLDNNSVRGMTSGLFRSAIPVLSHAYDLASTGFIAAKSALDSKTKFPAGDVGRMITTNIPAQNVWWARGLMHYYLLNGLREEFGPGYLGTLERSVSKNSGLFDDQQRYFMLRPTESPNWVREIYR